MTLIDGKDNEDDDYASDANDHDTDDIERIIICWHNKSTISFSRMTGIVTLQRTVEFMYSLKRNLRPQSLFSHSCVAHRNINVGIGTEATQFLVWKYLFRIFGIVSVQWMQIIVIIITMMIRVRIMILLYYPGYLRERVAQQRDAGRCVCSGCGLLLRLSHWWGAFQHRGANIFFTIEKDMQGPSPSSLLLPVEREDW
jgi:hypothetical protein